MNALRSLILCFALALTWASAFAQDPNLHIYLCFGQSNMEGNGTIETQDRVTNSRIQVMGAVNCSQGGRTYTLGKWQTYAPPTVRCNTGLSPADYFARTMTSNLASNIKIGIVPVAIGGCDIALFDKANYASYVATAPSWMIGNINAYGGNPYARLVEAAKLAQKDGVIKGILLHQGETNNTQQTWPGKVKAIYDNLIKDLGLNAAQTPLLVGELVTTAQGGACGAHNAIIATMPNVVPNSHVVSASGLPHVGDNLHFTSAAYRTLGERYATKMLSLLPKSNAPTASITAPANNSTFTTAQTVTITANATDSDGTIAKVEFYDGTTLLGSDNSSPYSFSWSGMSTGTHSITAKATDNSGAITTSSAVSITIQGLQTPFKGTVLTIPGRIEAEDYDLGGEGLAFHEANTSGNQGGATYRTDEVDVETTADAAGTYNVGYILNGEWLEYTVNVASSGAYNLDLRVATDGAGKTMHIEMDGTNITGAIAVPNTTGWQIWQTATVNNLNLTQGQHVMRIAFDADYMNLNYVEFKKATITALETLSTKNGAAYPNPFSNHVNVEMEGTFSFWLLDGTGMVLKYGLATDRVELNELLPKGIYWMKIQQNESVKVLKLLKE